jgi:AraC-like DNA-binding protein
MYEIGQDSPHDGFTVNSTFARTRSRTGEPLSPGTERRFFHLPLSVTNDEFHGSDDPLVSVLSRILLISLPEHPNNNLFVDHIALALYAYLERQRARVAPRHTRRGILARWQEVCAYKMLLAKNESFNSTQDVARACGLSNGHFARAFKATTGFSPCRWRLLQHIEEAKTLMRTSTRALADIAGECGFAEQSHFTRAFSQLVGSTPGAWRRAYKLGHSQSGSPVESPLLSGVTRTRLPNSNASTE